jgi:hypothetical protein
MTIIARYKAAPDFTGLAQSTRRAYLIYIKLIEDEFGDLPLGALVDRRVRGEFKSWRDKFGNTPRKADFAWTVLARILSFAKDRGIIAVNPCEDATRQPTPQDIQLMSKHRVLSFKPQLRLEGRRQDGQSETQQPDHSASLCDSITSSTRIRFSVHTAGRSER